MRIGLLTGGGDCPGLNAVIRAVVRKGIDGYGDEIVGFRDGWRGVLDDVADPLTIESTRGILPRGGTILGSSRTNPFKREDGAELVRQTLARHELDGLIAIGGEDTLGAANRLSEAQIKVIGVPKTIDNDLGATDVTFGFDTALHVATEAIDRLHTTAESHHRILVVEVMGRSAGWIALHSGLAGGADVILIPELPFDISEICRLIGRRHERGRYFSIVVVAEGARAEGGDDERRDRRAGRVRPSAARGHRPAAREGDRVSGRALRRGPPSSATRSAGGPRPRLTGSSRPGSDWRRSTRHTRIGGGT